MPSTGANASGRFAMMCLKCNRRIIAHAEWVGREVRCPHCAAVMCVPTPRDDGRPVRAVPPRVVPGGHRFSFSCPRCESLLESQVGMGGQTGCCPTCGARFVIPDGDRHSRVPQAASLIDGDEQDPTPMHAYAASGHQAPKTHRLADGSLQIECPRCGQRCDITANNCTGCGTPFSIEGVPTARAVTGDSRATAALVLGIVAVPICPLLPMVLIVGGLAVAFGLASWRRSGAQKQSKQAVAGMILGFVSILLSLLLRFS